MYRIVDRNTGCNRAPLGALSRRLFSVYSGLRDRDVNTNELRMIQFVVHNMSVLMWQILQRTASAAAQKKWNKIVKCVTHAFALLHR